MLCSGFITKNRLTITKAEAKSDVILNCVPAADIEKLMEDVKFKDRMVISCIYYFTNSFHSAPLKG